MDRWATQFVFIINCIYYIVVPFFDTAIDLPYTYEDLFIVYKCMFASAIQLQSNNRGTCTRNRCIYI